MDQPVSSHIRASKSLHLCSLWLWPEDLCNALLPINSTASWTHSRGLWRYLLGTVAWLNAYPRPGPLAHHLGTERVRPQPGVAVASRPGSGRNHRSSTGKAPCLQLHRPGTQMQLQEVYVSAHNSAPSHNQQSL